MKEERNRSRNRKKKIRQTYRKTVEMRDITKTPNIFKLPRRNIPIYNEIDLLPFNAWTIYPTQNKSALRGCKTKFLDFVCKEASATKSFEKSFQYGFPLSREIKKNTEGGAERPRTPHALQGFN